MVYSGKWRGFHLLPLFRTTGLFASKASATNRKLKLVFANGDPYTFTFPNGDDAEKFKGHLSDIVTRNKEKAAAVAAAGNAATTSANGAETPANGPQAESSNAEGSKQAGVGSSQLRSANAQKRRLNKNELKAAVLKRSPELARLHADLVRTGQISEAEFWEGREHLILAEAAADSQRKGKSSLIVDPRPVRDETGKATTKLSNEMIEEIFEEFPVVRRAYDENVPRRLTDQEFWSRYLQSKLASRNSASARGAASEHTVHDDAIFDKYLEKEDDGIEPKYQREHVKRRLVDLDATTQDHPETGNTQDVTMQAGKQRQALPLIRRFNEHSERLLNTALGDEPPAKRRRVTFADELVEDDYVDDIVMEDLHAPLSSNGIPLEMRDQQRYSQGGGSGNAMDVDAGDSLDIKAILPPLVRSLDTWAADMAQACNTVVFSIPYLNLLLRFVWNGNQSKTPSFE
ncbi:RNA polymerase II transcription factor B subunit 1 [Tulasnella sp. 403]|nr:RNA polymerase II transcription factor B subunit 1 [Tulasnella sp. 403]